METAELIWQNGEFVPWEDAKTHVLAHGLHYGTGVFEGVRCYETERGPAVFRHADHLDRLAKSAELYYFELPYSTEELAAATRELIRRNGLASCYIRPLAYRGYGNLGLYATDAPIDVIVAAFPWGVYLGEDGQKHGIRATVSSWRAISGDSLIPHAKAAGQYLNSILAKTEAPEGRLRRGDPARPARARLRGLRRERLRRPRRRAGHARSRQRDPRRDHARLGGADRRRPRLHGRGARRSPAPSSTSPTRSSSPAPPPSWSRCARSTTTRSASRGRSRG